MGLEEERSELQAQGYEGYWDYPGCAQAARAQLSEEKRFWGICDDRLKCSEPRFAGLQEESIRNLGMRAGCSPWHLPPAFDPSLVTLCAEDVVRCTGDLGSVWEHKAGMQKYATLVRYFREECDSFCIVRDPLERMISQLKFVYKLEQAETQLLGVLKSCWCTMFVDKLDLKQDCHAVPQVYYVFQDGNPKAAPICRHVLKLGDTELHHRSWWLAGIISVLYRLFRKFHEVNQSFPALMESYGLREVKLLSSLGDPVSEGFSSRGCALAVGGTLTPTPATLRMVQEFYAQDYEAFGFQLPKSTISL
ncbi:unnamed protein product [Symbiodinium necroappetens]|uniref:Sulfotransferase n=1 Tax=Symbiodinium necroappetens TaxID=1628268 RepID=A0A812MYY0_9DINO|nr:unnamed protein product [Symbiodinium necroappetens]